ncbi:MAG TPA: helicase-related protein [Polyangiales bacterium]|nr:helicase-related protein [Polyangiales bacterium]
MSDELPICALRDAFAQAIARGPVVLSSPTGSGKSTEVPRWCAGRVLVIEPRRIACRSLAARVAQREGCELGREVGYAVRDERAASSATRIMFATPGLALRDRALLEGADTLVLDEFHERNLEVDLLLALALRARRSQLVVMSATLEGERVAAHVGGTHLTASGRSHPVDVRHLAGSHVLPDAGELAERVRQALLTAADDPGDVLVFLPGKAEIEACAEVLRGDFTLVPLHGGLTLEQQRRAFERTPKRKVVLATNVAETALTIDGIGVVIDSGLVRRTHYRDGRSFLALTPIAEDSAAQRAGRAGRTAPGVCYRLWSASARLNTVTPPEIQRESLVSLLLAAAAWGERLETLPLLDAAPAPALELARRELQGWGACDAGGAIAEPGRALFALPVEPAYGRLLIAAREHGCLDAMIDLVSVLSVGRPLFVQSPTDLGHEADLRAAGCDASAAIAALRAERPAHHRASELVVREARQTRKRLRRMHDLPELEAQPAAFDRDALIRACIAADARRVYIARRRGRELVFANGGPELALARESAANNVRELEALIALEVRGFGEGREARTLITCALPIALHVLARSALGRERVAAVKLERGRVTAKLERVFAGRVIAESEQVPSGALAHDALVELLLRGSLFREAVATTRQRLLRAALAAKLAARGHPAGVASEQPIPSLEAWLRARLQSLGFESAADLPLLSDKDFIVPDLPYESRGPLDEAYPSQVQVGDATYRADYEIERNQVVLRMIKGSRRDPPPLGYLPKFPGLRIIVEGPRGVSILREHG